MTCLLTFFDDILLGGLEPWDFMTVNHKYMVNIWKYMVIYGIL